MFRFARAWLLLALPFYFLAHTDLIEEWTPFAWTLFYFFVGFGIFSVLLSLFEDAAAKVPAKVVELAPASSSLEAAEALPAISAIPAPVVALALGVSTVALASSTQLEAPGPAGSPLSIEGVSGPAAV